MAEERPSSDNRPATDNRPYLPTPVTLNSFAAQRARDEFWEEASEACFGLSVKLRRIAGEEEAGKVEEIADKTLAEAFEKVRAERERLRQLREENGADRDPVFPNPRQEEVPVSSPRAGQFLGLIQQVDELMTDLTALWQSGVFSDSQFDQGVRRWEREIQRLSGRLKQLTGRAIKLARSQEGMEGLRPDGQSRTDQSGPDANGQEDAAGEEADASAANEA